MGVIRTLLALAVVLYHSYGIGKHDNYMTGGMVSVETFYIISGFYMAMILNEKYRTGSYRLFITNRFLRIFPLYWACLLLVLAVCILGKIFYNDSFYLWYWTSQWSHLAWSSIILMILANIFLFGSDWLLFTGVKKETGTLAFTTTPYNSNPLSGQYLLIPQIWSVGIEFSFYLFAPFLVRTKWFLQFLLVLAALTLRYFLYAKNLNYDPWTYRFFPNEIAFFLAGSLAYKASVLLKEKKISSGIGFAGWLIILFCIIYYPHFSFIPLEKRCWYFYSLFLILLPFIFIYSKSFSIDRFIGELSFPIYVCHHVIMFMWRRYFFTPEHSAQMNWFGIVTALCSIAAAVLLYFGVVRPVEKVRARRAAKAQLM
ncbi:MAG: acyltransferase [Bacteroidetes bacterium]|nr:acyltransferase [Bacteroidota bacterium]